MTAIFQNKELLIILRSTIMLILFQISRLEVPDYQIKTKVYVLLLCLATMFKPTTVLYG